MAASPTSAEQPPASDTQPSQELDTKRSVIDPSGTDADAKADNVELVGEQTEANTLPSADVGHPEDSEVEPQHGELQHGEPQQAELQQTEVGDENMTFRDLRAAVDEIDENLDDAFGQAADSFWNFATSVTGKVSSVVKDQQGLETLRKNVTSRLTPLGNISRDIQTQIGTFAPNEKSIATLTDSVQKVAETVQRNAVAMEEAILARANDVGDPSASTTVVGEPPEIAVDDPGVVIMPEMQGDESGKGIDGIAKVGESVSNAIEQTVGGLWSGLLGMDDSHGYAYGEKTVEMPKTRFGKRIFELQANPDTYCEPAEDLDSFEEWGQDFSLDNYEAECVEILETHDSIAELYERVVPRVIEEDTFWMRYFFAKHNLELEEERRQKLLQRAEHAVDGADEEDDGWGDDDWGDDSPNDGDGDTRSKESPRKDSADTTEAPGPAPEVSIKQTEKSEQKPESALKVSQKVPEKASLKDENPPSSSKEVEDGKKLKDQVAVQDGDDDWGDDDWE